MNAFAATKFCTPLLPQLPLMTKFDKLKNQPEDGPIIGPKHVAGIITYHI
jgi:hypothetical protein